MSYLEEIYSNISHINNGDIILLVTATDLETSVLHQRLEPIPQYHNIIKIYEENLTIYFGVLGKYKIAHVQCSMGSLSRDSSILTTSEAIELIKPQIVIMIGIAFGIDDVNQKIGDVLIAEAIQPYNNKRINENEDIQRAYALPSSKLLLNRFRNLTGWEYLLDEFTKAKVIYSLVLSGEELIDNKPYRDSLIAKYPTAKGGEMEGAGVYSACNEKAHCILVKGICDFADGNKSTNKKSNQTIAMDSAISVCSEILSSSSIFKKLNILPAKKESEEETSINLNEILFDIYDKSKESYYINRDVDNNFDQIISQYGVWVYGISGCGKSNLIFRNLIENDFIFIQISLASCIGISVESFFNEILFELSSKIEGVYSQIQPQTFIECSRAILNLLKRKYGNQKLVIFIEEIPLGNQESHKEFTERFFALLISKTLMSGLENVKFVLSSINDPTFFIQEFNQKIHQQMKFLKLENWSEEDTIRLIDLINRALNLHFDKNICKIILTRSNGSPRFIKKFFRNLIAINKTPNAIFKEVLDETERELIVINHA